MLRRLESMAKRATVRGFNPQPWFPVLRPSRPSPIVPNANVNIDVGGMFYIPGVGKRFDSFWMQRCVEKWLRQLDPSVVSNAILDAHFGYPEGVGCFRAGQRLGIPVFITLRGLELELFGRRSHGPQLVHALQSATGVIAVSNSLKEAAVLAGVPEQQIAVIPNGVDAVTFRPGDKDDARDVLSYPITRKLVVCIAELRPVKGHDVLLRAFAAMRENDVHVVCVGRGLDSQWGKKLQSLVKELQIENRVFFAGSLPPEDVAIWLRASDVFALASHREGCCNAVLEALATGTPVAATDVGDNRLFVNQSGIGRIVSSGDPESLAQAISECLECDFDQATIAASIQDYTWETAASRVIERFGQDRSSRDTAEKQTDPSNSLAVDR